MPEQATVRFEACTTDMLSSAKGVEMAEVSRPGVQLSMRVGLDYLVAVVTLVVALAISGFGFDAARRATAEIRGSIQPIVAATNQMLEALEQMENAEFLYFGKGPRLIHSIEVFDRNASRFEESYARASELVADSEARGLIATVSTRYRTFVITDGRIRALLASGNVDGAESLNLTQSMDQAEALRTAVRGLRVFKLGIAENRLASVNANLVVAEIIAISIALAGLVLGGLIWLRTWRALGAPLLALLEGTRAVSAGRYVRVDHPAARGTSEILELQASFNAMSSRIEATTAELEAARQGLETTVEERTAELSAANERLGTMVEDLRAVDKMKSDLLSVVSHELFTPLNFVTGNASLLEDEVLGALSKDQQRAVASILDGAKRLIRMVRNMLDFLELEKGIAVRLEEIDCKDIVTSVAAAVVETLDGDARRLKLEVEVPAVLPPIVADPDRVGQVLAELLDNAVKFSPDGGRIKVKVRVMDDEVETSISDAGPGVPPELIHRLTEPFFQVDLSSTRRHGGLGLGLAIVRHLVDRMGGRLSIDSRPGEGSTFRFSLPRADSAPRLASSQS